MNKDLIVTNWNPICESIFKWTREEAIGKKISDLTISDPDRQVYNDDFVKAFKSVDRQIRTFISIDKDKRELHLKVKLCQLDDQSYICFIPSCQFEEVEPSWKMMLDSAGYFVTIKDKDGVYLDVNHNAERALNRKRADIIGKTDFDVFPYDVARRRAEYDAEVFQTGNILNKEETVSVDGRLIHVFNTRCPHRDAQGKVTRLQIIGRDITGYREAIQKVADLEKKAIQTSEQLALQSSRLKTQFLANMSHEIRTPVNGILGMVNLLAETSLTEEQREYVTGTLKMCGSLMSVINDIMDFSKLESDKLQIEMVDMSIEDLVEDLKVMYSFLAKNKGIKFVLDWSQVRDRNYIRCDHGRLRQILSNLLNNAIKFTFTGSVTLTISVVDKQEPGAIYSHGELLKVHSPTTTHQNGSFLKFSISDTGIGIEESKMAILFKPFTQADASMTRRFGGTGLGLSICKSLVELLHGEIHLDSEFGKGSTIWFTIPYIPSNIVRKPIESVVSTVDIQADISSMTLNILVVDDNVMNQKVTIKMLEKLGHKALGADNGLEALQMLQMNPLKFDLVFMDCQMPVMDGYEATIQIRKLPKPIGDIIIIAMTANVLNDEREHCLEVGMNDYMPKPVRKSELVQTLQLWGQKAVLVRRTDTDVA